MLKLPKSSMVMRAGLVIHAIVSRDCFKQVEHVAAMSDKLAHRVMPWLGKPLVAFV